MRRAYPPPRLRQWRGPRPKVHGMRRLRVPGLLAVLVLLTMLVAGCGDDKSPGAAATPSVGAADNLISRADLDGSNLNTAAERAKAPPAPGQGSPVVPAVPAPGVPGGTPTAPTGTVKPTKVVLELQRCLAGAGGDPAKAAKCLKQGKTP